MPGRCVSSPMLRISASSRPTSSGFSTGGASLGFSTGSMRFPLPMRSVGADVRCPLVTAYFKIDRTSASTTLTVAGLRATRWGFPFSSLPTARVLLCRQARNRRMRSGVTAASGVSLKYGSTCASKLSWFKLWLRSDGLLCSFSHDFPISSKAIPARRFSIRVPSDRPARTRAKASAASVFDLKPLRLRRALPSYHRIENRGCVDVPVAMMVPNPRVPGSDP